MPNELTISEMLADLKILAPAGYALAFHVTYTTPTLLFRTYPKAWIAHYSQHGLVLRDPTVRWQFENEGTCRWSDLTAQDDDGVLAKAAEFGLRFGACAATAAGGTRSLAGMARSDREFTDVEIASFADLMSTLHRLTAETRQLQDDTMARLKAMAINVIAASES